MSRRKRRCNLCGAKLKGDICPECGYNNAAWRDASGESGAEHVGNFENWVEDDEKYKYADLTGEEQTEDSRYRDRSEKESEKSEPESSENRVRRAGRTWGQKKQEADEAPEEESADSWNYSQMEQEYESGGARVKPQWGVPNQDPRIQGMKERAKRKRRGLTAAVLVLLALWLLPWIADGLGELAEDIRWEFSGDQDDENSGEDGGSWMDVKTDFDNDPAAGASFETQLSPGLYVAGLHIPAGTYQARLVSGSGSVYLWDNGENASGDWQSNYLYDGDDRDSRTLEDLELAPDTVLQIGGDLALTLTTRSQEGMEKGTANPLRKETVITDCAVVGEDLEAGTYLVTATENLTGYGSLIHRYVNSFDTQETEIMSFTQDQSQYQNLIVREGDVLVTVNCTVRLSPAEYDLSRYRAYPY